MKILQSQLAGQDNDTKTVELQLTGTPEILTRIMGLLGMIEYAGAVGHSGSFAVFVDGDGADRVQVSGDEYDELVKRCRPYYAACSSYGGTFECVGEGNSELPSFSVQSPKLADGYAHMSYHHIELEEDKE